MSINDSSNILNQFVSIKILYMDKNFMKRIISALVLVSFFDLYGMEEDHVTRLNISEKFHMSYVHSVTVGDQKLYIVGHAGYTRPSEDLNKPAELLVVSLPDKCLVEHSKIQRKSEDVIGVYDGNLIMKLSPMSIETIHGESVLKEIEEEDQELLEEEPLRGSWTMQNTREKEIPKKPHVILSPNNYVEMGGARIIKTQVLPKGLIVSVNEKGGICLYNARTRESKLFRRYKNVDKWGAILENSGVFLENKAHENCNDIIEQFITKAIVGYSEKHGILIATWTTDREMTTIELFRFDKPTPLYTYQVPSEKLNDMTFIPGSNYLVVLNQGFVDILDTNALDFEGNIFLTPLTRHTFDTNQTEIYKRCDPFKLDWVVLRLDDTHFSIYSLPLFKKEISFPLHNYYVADQHSTEQSLLLPTLELLNFELNNSQVDDDLISVYSPLMRKNYRSGMN